LVQSFFQKQNEKRIAAFSNSSLILQIKMLNQTSLHTQRQLLIRVPSTLSSTGKADFNMLLKKNLKRVARIISSQDLTGRNIKMECRLIFLSADVKLPASDERTNTKFFNLVTE